MKIRLIKCKQRLSANISRMVYLSQILGTPQINTGIPHPQVSNLDPLLFFICGTDLSESIIHSW